MKNYFPVFHAVSFSTLYFTFTRDIANLEIPVEGFEAHFISGNCNYHDDLKYDVLVQKKYFLTSLKPTIMSWSKPAEYYPETEHVHHL